MNSSFTDTLAELRQQFADQLPGRIDAIRAQLRRVSPDAWQLAEVEVLHRLVHGLTGSAGTFGMNTVSEAARALEIHLAAMLKNGQAPDRNAWQEAEFALDRLETLSRTRLDSNAPSLKPQDGIFLHPDRSPLIHLVEDDPEQARHLSHVLESEGYRVRVFTDLDQFRAARADPDSGEEQPAALIMDMVFPGNSTGGADAIAELRAERHDCPPLVFSSVRDDLAARLAAYRAGASSYLVKPVDSTRLCQLLDELTGRIPADPYRIVLVDDDVLLLEVYASMLRDAGMTVQTVSQPLQTLDVIQAFKPDVVVLDMYMPDASGPELAAIMREKEEFASLPILFLSAEADVGKQLLALNLGGDDFLVKPLQPDHFVAAVSARARRGRQNGYAMQRLKLALYEREREHQALDQHDLVSIADAQGLITYANDNFCAVSGYSREELLGQNHRMLKSGEHPPEFYRDMWRTLASGNIWHGEVCNRKKDGSLYWVLASITPFLDGEGKPYQYVSIRTDITPLKQSQMALISSEERLRRGQIYANIGTWDWNIETGTLYWTERISPLFGYPVGELETSYENFLNAVHPDDRQAVMDAVNACVEHDEPYEIEHRVVWPDGTVRWLLERGAVVRDAEGRATQMLGVVQDINVRKHAELVLADREHQLREAQTLAHIGNWQADLVTGELTWSEEIYRIFGHKPGCFKPSVEAFVEAVHPDDRALVRESEKRAEQTGIHDVVHRIVLPDGTVRHVHELARVERNDAGQTVRMLGTVQDITFRVEAETRLRASEERFSFAVEGAGDGIWDWNMESGEMRLSGHYETMLGFEQGELEPTVDAWIKSVCQDDLARVQQALQDYLAGKLAAYVVEFRLRCKDGGYKWVLCRGTVVARDAGGKALRMIGIHSDISERKAVEAALVEAREAAERGNQAKSEFLSSMSHELRTPMNAILGFSQMLEYDDDLNEDQQDNVQEILKAGHHLLELINEVLDLAKVESGRIDLSLEPVELVGLIEDCRSLIQPLAKARQLNCSLDILPGAAVRVDHVRLKQVLLNLLSNAVKYNREGGEIRLAVRPAADGRMRIEVSDSGAGIPAERMPELFQPFSRLDAEHSAIEGTGIGLTISRRLVEMMDGEIGVESRVGVGSTFWIELLAEDLPPSASADHGGTDTSKQKAIEHFHRVLCIDDNPINLKLIAQILGKRQHIHLVTAHTPDLGIELAMAHRPELILLDINMPGMDGYQVLDIFKSDADLRSIPVVAITANAMLRDIERGRAAGFSEYLTKPFEVGLFLKIVDTYLTAGNTDSKQKAES